MSLLNGRRFAALDVETTGWSAREDTILEVATVTIEAAAIVNEWSSFVGPPRPGGRASGECGPWPSSRRRARMWFARPRAARRPRREGSRQPARKPGKEKAPARFDRRDTAQ